MDFSQFKMTFTDVVDALCKYPQMYTMNGTFGEVLAFLDGYAKGKKIGKVAYSCTYFHPFKVWLATKMGYAEDANVWESFISNYLDEATALRGFARLFREYADTNPDSIIIRYELSKI